MCGVKLFLDYHMITRSSGGQLLISNLPMARETYVTAIDVDIACDEMYGLDKIAVHRSFHKFFLTQQQQWLLFTWRHPDLQIGIARQRAA